LEVMLNSCVVLLSTTSKVNPVPDTGRLNDFVTG
jgi:hypothetical protein